LAPCVDSKSAWIYVAHFGQVPCPNLFLPRQSVIKHLIKCSIQIDRRRWSRGNFGSSSQRCQVWKPFLSHVRVSLNHSGELGQPTTIRQHTFPTGKPTATRAAKRTCTRNNAAYADGRSEFATAATTGGTAFPFTMQSEAVVALEPEGVASQPSEGTDTPAAVQAAKRFAANTSAVSSIFTMA
jgi:hypothetical protein